MKLEMSILAGDESKKFLTSLTTQIDRLEALSKGLGKGAPEEAVEVEEDEDEDFAPKKSSKKAAASFDDDDEHDEEGKVDEDEEEEVPKKKSKSKKVTSDDCNDAAKALAKHIGGKPGRDAVLKIMKKQFKTESVSELKPEQYSDFVAAMNEAKEEAGE